MFSGVRSHPSRIASRLFALALILIFAAATGNAVAQDGSGRKYVRPFGPNAPWNVPVRSLPRHPESDRLARMLWTKAPSRPGNFNLGFEQYTYPVYDAADATGEFRIRTKWKSNLNGQTIPWNPEWRPAPGEDAQVIILDHRRGIEWNLFQVRFRDGVVYATNGSQTRGDFRTYEGGNVPSRGIGIAYLAMLVRPEEIRQGEIRHALSMPIRNTSGQTFVAPATKLEFDTGRPGIPEGTRFALDITDAEIRAWSNTLPREMRQAGRIIARALRDYGWFITDTAGGATFQFEARVSAGAEWDRLGLRERRTRSKIYPNDLLDGLITQDNIYAIVPSDQYPSRLRARNR